MKYDTGLTLATEIKNLLAPTCHRVEIAGGIRRQKQEVHDIEIVLVPKTTEEFGFTTETEKKLWELYDAGLFREGEKSKDGKKAPMGGMYWRVKFKGEKTDIFFVNPPAQWGCIFLIRTGDKDFSHWIVQQGWKYGIHQIDGHLERVTYKESGKPFTFQYGEATSLHQVNREVINTQEEDDYFRAMNIPWVNPENRTLQWLREHAWAT